MSVSNIPFLDLVTPHKELEQDLVEAFRKALHTAGFIGGPAVEGFEKEFAAFCDSKHCVGVANGTDALRFALMAAGIQPGDAVITVPNTFIATTEAISQAGGRPYFVDIDERTYNMDPARLREFLQTKCTRNAGQLVTNDLGLVVKAVLPVHLYGQMADMDSTMEIADEFELLVIEDACQAHGAEYFSRKLQKWVKPGFFGVAAAYSFYPGKNLGACGEAGAVTTNNDDIAKRIRVIRDHGQAKKYYHDVEGYNGRLDAIQAAFLSVKLKHLPEWTELRRAVAKRYDELFRGDNAVLTPFVPPTSKPVFHLYIVRVQERESLQKSLSAAGIATGIHYPIPLHQQAAYRYLGYNEGHFPVTERVAPEILSLPMFPTLRLDQQELVVAKIKEFAGAGVS